MYNTRQTIEKNMFTAENIRNCEKHTLSMQRRLDKVVANNDSKGIRETFDLLAKKSNAVKILATWRITQRNQGKYTAGIDGIALPKGDRETQQSMRLNLLENIDIGKTPDPIKRVFIPKPNGDKRPLGIPTIHDRIIQEILRIALEPIVEYHFSDSSYGFRPKRSCQDAMTQLFNIFSRPDGKRYVIEGDIKGCFDNINHNHILKTLDNWDTPQWAINTISKMLKSGILHNNDYSESEVGTPQGGVISPLLANVALTTFDNFCEKYGKTKFSYERGTYRYNPLVRYADDFVIPCISEPEAEEIKAEITAFLKDKIGLTLSQEKTKITHITKGFNFLGFNFRKYKKDPKRSPLKAKQYKATKPVNEKWVNHVLLITPQKEKVLNLLKKCQEVLDTHQATPQGAVIKLIDPILIGWGMYYRHVVSSDTFAKIDHEIWWKFFRWSKRRHPNKSKKWVITKYFSRQNGHHRFADKETKTWITNLSQIPIRRFVKVRGGTRVYDNDPKAREYWNKREYTNVYEQIHSVRMRKLYDKQKGKCPVCKEQLTQEEIKESQLHIHHLKPRSLGGSESYSNLRLLHDHCHRELHRKLTRKEMSELIDKGNIYLNIYK